MDERVAAVRAFNRFYTGVIGVLDATMLQSPFSLTEARVLFELDQRGRMEVVELRGLLDLDAGYLSRLLSRFETDGLITREKSADDGRRQIVALTGEGRSTFADLDDRSAAHVRDLLAKLTEENQRRLISAMTTIRRTLDGDPKAGPYVIRPPRSGDLGWVVYRHGVLYGQEYGWGQGFEALVAGIVAGYGERHDPEREAGWIAEVDGERAGCVFCVRKDDETAQLRLLLVEPSARGMGIGAGLVRECLHFAAGAGYKRIMLWTRANLLTAGRIYAAAGFELMEEHPGEDSGKKVVEQIWTRDLP
ncbi:helix-turn-helix domain-containing GNAT family N-acetyltransferase [Streptosporangium sp. KLBMP 9127]|nr:helix-turn-helix domain-containing GNAT family N-acetyltransferase [Streptosporangium sp. KLBMP 9127]